jgi:hypothetical protein
MKSRFEKLTLDNLPSHFREVELKMDETIRRIE